MPIVGQNPFGPEFFELAKEGAPAYPMDEVTPTRVAPRALDRHEGDVPFRHCS